MIDAALVVFERVEFANFFVNRLNSDHPDLKTSIQALQKQESIALAATRSKLLHSIEPKVKSIRVRVSREPAYDNSTRQWVRTMASKFENRFNNIKNQNW